jgi:hypothetical protein
MFGPAVGRAVEGLQADDGTTGSQTGSCSDFGRQLSVWREKHRMSSEASHLCSRTNTIRTTHGATELTALFLCFAGQIFPES